MVHRPKAALPFLAILLVLVPALAALAGEGLAKIQPSLANRIEAGEEFNLPIITGLGQEAAQTAQGRQDLAEAMEIVARLSRAGSPLLLDQVSEIRFSLGSGATILPLSSGPRIILGRGGMELKVEHWKKVLADLEDKGIRTRVDYIDLRLGDKAFVGLKAG